MTTAAREFVFTAQPSRVVFARGSLRRLAQEVEALGARRALVLCTPQQVAIAQAASDLLGPASAGVFSGAEMHVPIASARRAREHARAVALERRKTPTGTCHFRLAGGHPLGVPMNYCKERDHEPE